MASSGVPLLSVVYIPSIQLHCDDTHTYRLCQPEQLDNIFTWKSLGCFGVDEPNINDGMAEHALRSERRFLTVAALTNQTFTPLPQGGRLGDFAQPGKSARLVDPRVADREDVRRSETMDGSL